MAAIAGAADARATGGGGVAMHAKGGTRVPSDDGDCKGKEPRRTCQAGVGVTQVLWETIWTGAGANCQDRSKTGHGRQARFRAALRRCGGWNTGRGERSPKLVSSGYRFNIATAAVTLSGCPTRGGRNGQIKERKNRGAREKKQEREQRERICKIRKQKEDIEGGREKQFGSGVETADSSPTVVTMVDTPVYEVVEEMYEH
ncbi:hypothetical protein BDV93DRAFT_515268 [Ceratobasidium sp. AG-I]|nr:hypothetical protein BDV93DRAFT_515268 [Ceratobasidium sp. AG-I]